jgi:hypothetical protein
MLKQLNEAAKRVLHIIENDHSIKERDEAYAELRDQVAAADKSIAAAAKPRATKKKA